MKKILGIVGLLVVVSLLTAIKSPESFLSAYNLENLLRRGALFGIISIGAAFVIITSGIDLSIGSVVCLVGCLLPWLLKVHGWPVAAALPLVLSIPLLIGLIHGLLVAKLRIQPFVVTLCGLLLYRGAMRGLTGDQAQGFGTGFEALKYLALGKPFSIPLPLVNWIRDGSWGDWSQLVLWVACPMPAVILVIVGVAAAVFLNLTVYGRYLLALGRNEEAARYSGINTDRMVILAYVLCAGLAGLGGMLFVLDVNSAQPVDFGNFYELYAIAAAVLGGCSLRGGEGSILGVIVGATVMQVLRNSITLVGIPTQLEFAIIGAVILAGVIADELVKRLAARRRAAREARDR